MSIHHGAGVLAHTSQKPGMLKKIITSPFFIFPVITCICFWPLTFQLLSLKNDALTYYYPVRTLISDAIRNGELPLWTPFINMGYPLHGDLQSGAWNPVIWVFSLLTNYSLAAFHYELLFYISFAGIGFYYLCREFGSGKAVAFSLGFAFQFSGFITDSVQFFTCISSACYLPFIFLFFKRTLMRYRWQDAGYTGLGLFFLFTGGYPALFIITGYILLAYGLFYFFSAPNKLAFARAMLPLVLAMVVAFVLLSLPAMLSFADYLPRIKRGDGLSLATAGENPMHPLSLVSVLAPFANTANKTVLASSVLMQNLYFGIILLVFLVLTLISPSVRIKKETGFFLVSALVFLLLSWGGFFVLHKLAYYILPFFDRFRHPGLLRLPAIFFLLLAINASMNRWASGSIRDNPLLSKIIVVLVSVLTAFGIVAGFLQKQPLFEGLFRDASLAEILQQLSFSERYLLQLPVLLIVLFLFYKALGKTRYLSWLMFLVAADMFCSVQFNMPVTIVGSRSMSFIEAHLQRNPERFPLPGNESIRENSIHTGDRLLITGSKLLFTKKIGRNDYFITPGNLQLQDSFYASPARDISFANPVLYLADTLVDAKYISAGASGLKNAPFFTGLATTKLTAASYSDSTPLAIVNLSANRLEAVIGPLTYGTLVLQQNAYPGWKVFIDGNEQEIKTGNITFMAVAVPPGSRNISFIYRPVKVITAFFISLFAWLGLFVILIKDLFLIRRPGKLQQEGLKNGAA